MTALAPGLELFFEAGVCRLKFGNTATKNAISMATAEALGGLSAPHAQGGTELQNLLEQNRCGLFVLESSCENIFVSGGNLKELAALSAHEGEIFTTLMRQFCKGLSALPVPSVALLEGPAYGGGTELALAADFRAVLSPSAALHFWQTRWGVPGGWNGMARLSELVPAWSARRVGLLFVLQASLSCADLVRVGLADFDYRDRSAPSVALELQALATRVLECPPALRVDLLSRTTSDADAALFERYWLKSEHRERLAAFSKKALFSNTPEG